MYTLMQVSVYLYCAASGGGGGGGGGGTNTHLTTTAKGGAERSVAADLGGRQSGVDLR